MNGIDIFTMLYKKEIDDNTYIVYKHPDHECDNYWSKEELELSSLLFDEYTYDLIDKEEALNIERRRDLIQKKEHLLREVELIELVLKESE